MKPTGKFEERRAKYFLMLLCPPHISCGLARNRIRASQVREQRLTAPSRATALVISVSHFVLSVQNITVSYVVGYIYWLFISVPYFGTYGICNPLQIRYMVVLFLVLLSVRWATLSDPSQRD